MKPEIYADGKPVYGIGELKLDLMDPENPPEVVKVASPIEATVRMNLEPGKVYQLLCESTKQAAEAFRSLAEAVKQYTLSLDVPAYWYHMARCANKARVRKKYLSRIYQFKYNNRECRRAYRQMMQLKNRSAV